MKEKIAERLRKVANKIDPKPTIKDLWEKGIWVTAQRELMPVDEIGDEHLVNIANMLWRQAGERVDRAAFKIINSPFWPQGEMAELAVLSDLDVLAEYGQADIFVTHPFYPFLADELTRRGLWMVTNVNMVGGGSLQPRGAG